MRLVLSVLTLGLVAVAAQAQGAGLDQHCMAMKDPVGCTCALAEGGSVSKPVGAGTGTWARARGSDPVVFDGCVAERGGPGRARPQTIPGRL